ncbi:hypothetical protein [Lysobacter firmicutimachus]|uniref:Uncharacterized protein n=1 Tax=Lysobacter firmicutimachus TaxID=1792846 RepID=A0ABU8D7N2_9GAMM
MAAKLDIKIIDEDVGLEVLFRFQDDGFLAGASAWFALSQLLEFCESLESYPIAPDALPLLIGGYWSSDGLAVQQEHVRLSVVPSGNQGQLELSVSLGVPPAEGRGVLQRYAMARIAIYYSEAEELAKGLRSLALAGEGESSFLFGL